MRGQVEREPAAGARQKEELAGGKRNWAGERG